MGAARRLELGRRTVRVLEFLDDKDLFQRIYIKLLQQRLLSSREVCVPAVHWFITGRRGGVGLWLARAPSLRSLCRALTYGHADYGCTPRVIVRYDVYANMELERTFLHMLQEVRAGYCFA